MTRPTFCNRGSTIAPAALVASGGWCAPVAPLYNMWGGPHWLLPDRPWSRDIDVDRWLFPRLTRWAKAFSVARRRAGLAVAALRGTQDVVVDPDDDEWW